MSEVRAEIIKTEETQESGIKYLNINVSNSEVERDPDVVRLCSDARILEYAKPCDDVVSRQTLDEINELMTDINGDTVYAVKMSDLRQLPPVALQPKTGHWINAKVGRLFPSNDFKCSVCGNILDFSGVNCGRGDANYCPNCGVKMVDSQEGSEL